MNNNITAICRLIKKSLSSKCFHIYALHITDMKSKSCIMSVQPLTIDVIVYHCSIECSELSWTFLFCVPKG